MAGRAGHLARRPSAHCVAAEAIARNIARSARHDADTDSDARAGGGHGADAYNIIIEAMA